MRQSANFFICYVGVKANIALKVKETQKYYCLHLSHKREKLSTQKEQHIYILGDKTFSDSNSFYATQKGIRFSLLFLKTFS